MKSPSLIDPYVRAFYRTHSLARDTAGIDTVPSLALSEKSRRLVMFRVCARRCGSCEWFTHWLTEAGFIAYKSSPLEMYEIPTDAPGAADGLPEVMQP